MSTLPLLLVDDDAAFRRVYVPLLKEAGFEVAEAADRPSAQSAFAEGRFAIVLLDLMLPPDGSVETGLSQLEALVAQSPGTKVIVVSGVGDTRSMVQAVKAGAYDFLTKPVDPDALLVVVERAQARVMLEQQVTALKTSLAAARPGVAMMGESAAFRSALALVDRFASSDLPVLVTGENGTGKELLARALHAQSRRATGPYLSINCGALTDTLLESTLFGHVKGAFTGASRDHVGLFFQADKGTLFLDEIGDMSPLLQVKVLRAIELGEILPVGAEKISKVDVRVVSATNRDLLAMQKTGAFREDLYWRIKGAEIRLPPLRERAGDVALLAKHFLNECAHLCADGRPKLLSDAAQEALTAHAWPGNIRELRHEMQRASVMAGERREIEPEDLSFGSSERPTVAPGMTTLAQKVETLERREIEEALKRSGQNRTHAAQALGLSRQGLLKKLERYGL